MTLRSITASMQMLEHYCGTYTATQTPSSGVDLKGLRQAEVVVYVGAVTNIDASPDDASWTFTLEHSDLESSGFAAVADDDVVLEDGGSISSGLFATVDAAAEDEAIYRVGYVGSKRFLRVVATAASTPGDSPIAVMVVGEKLLVAD